MQPIDATDAEYARQLKENPLLSDLWRMRARIALQNRRTNDAVELLKTGLNYLPADKALIADLADIYLRLRDSISARPLLDGLLKAQGKRPELIFKYARLLWIEGDYDQALEHFNEALTDNPENKKIATSLAQAYVSLGEIEMAIEFLKTWRHQESSVEMMALLALCEFDTHGIENALNAVLIGMQIHPSDPTINYLYAVLLKLSGDSVKAETHIAQIQQYADIRIQWNSFLFAYGSSKSPRFHGLGSTLLEAAIAQAPTSGLVLEFGVYHGLSLRQLARRVIGPVHGFDSFEGLPEAWKSDEPIGSYSAHGHLPQMPPQVVLYPGWFKDTLPAFVANQTEKVRLINIDCDLYSSTCTVLNKIYPLLQTGAILVFDEYLGYPGYEEHEFRAWHQFSKEFKIAYEYTGFSLMARKAVLRITKV